MAHETNQNIPMPQAQTQPGCRQLPPAADETGRTPAEDMGGGQWIYGDPQLTYGGRPASGGIPGSIASGTNMPGVMFPGGADNAPMPIPGMNGTGMPGGMSSTAAQSERMRNPVDMAGTHTPSGGQQAYQASLRSLLDRNVGYFIVATFLVGTQQSVTWQGILHTVGSDYMVLYQPDYERYISCDLYSLKFAQFHNVKGVPYCAASQSWQGQTTF